MNKGTLPIVARLQSLQAPARFAPGQERVIAEVMDRNPLAQLLRAVNETMLGRSLRFQSSTGASLTLDVAGRRVLRISAASGLPGAETCLGVETLEDEHKDDLIKLLQAVAAPWNELRVVSGPIVRGGAEVSVGLPVALLADLLLIELNETGAEEPEPVVEVPAPVTAPREEPDAAIEPSADLLGRFAQKLDHLLLAFVLSGGEEDGKTSGPEEMVSHLQGFLADEDEALSRQLDLIAERPGGPVCIVLGATLNEGHCIICARVMSAMLLGVVEGDATGAVLPAWSTAQR